MTGVSVNMINTNSNTTSNDVLVEVMFKKIKLSQSMYEGKLRGEHMTHVRSTFFSCPKKWTNCQKKKAGGFLTNSCLRVGGGGE